MDYKGLHLTLAVASRILPPATLRGIIATAGYSFQGVPARRKQVACMIEDRPWSGLQGLPRAHAREWRIMKASNPSSATCIHW
jgi:hypothetical protein